jgi:ABC-type multidrug transport system ATPase subunit
MSRAQVVSVQDEIFGWVQGFEPWKQELFIRAAAAPDLGDGSAEEIAAMLLGEEEEEGHVRPREVKREDLLEADADREPMTIGSVSELRNVNAIEEGQTLAFEPAGVNVVWGANGAGKTGYSRVLKKAGRTLHDEEILTNVYKVGGGRPTATLIVRVGEEEQREELALDEEPSLPLARICVADSHAGQIYLSEETEVDYVPTSLAGLTRLARGLDAVKAVLIQRREGVQVPSLDPTSFGPGTKVADLLSRMNADTAEDELRTLAGLDETEQARRDELRRTMREIQAMQAPKLREAAEREAGDLVRLRDDLATVAAHLNATAIKVVVEREKALKEAGDAADLVARRFDAEPLSEVGSQPWRALWAAARRYAEHIGQDFPTAHDRALCPLCMQDLSADTQRRLTSFDEFVRDDVNAQLGKLQEEKAATLSRLPDIGVIRDRHPGAMTLLGEGADEPGAAVRNWIDAADQRLDRIRKGELEGLQGLDPPPDLSAWIEKRTEEADRQLKIERAEGSKRVEKGLAEFDARHLLSERLADVISRLTALKEIAGINSAIGKIGTGGVSRKISSFSEEFVRAGLEEALKRQLRDLELRDIDVVPETRTVRGQTFVGLVLKTVNDVSLTSVLSQGEQRRLALAMFLAEMEVRSDPSPIVLDDPTSSIDQEGRRRIARTLLELGKRRQLIVFTHELSLVMDLQRYSTSLSQISIQHVTRLGGTVGHVRPSLPWDGLSATERRGDLDQKLVRLRTDYEERDEEKYRQQAADFCARLRQAFERAVEDLVLAGVITRRSDDVHTKKLRNINYTEEICDLVDRGMSENSPWVHDRPHADGSSPPSPDELTEGLDVLADLLKAVGDLDKARRKDADRRKSERVADLKSVDLAGTGDLSEGGGAEPHLMPVPDPPSGPDIDPSTSRQPQKQPAEKGKVE